MRNSTKVDVFIDNIHEKREKPEEEEKKWLTVVDKNAVNSSREFSCFFCLLSFFFYFSLCLSLPLYFLSFSHFLLSLYFVKSERSLSLLLFYHFLYSLFHFLSSHISVFFCITVFSLSFTTPSIHSLFFLFIFLYSSSLESAPSPSCFFHFHYCYLFLNSF
ncbi:unnamed protein product [Acanthosepion pharaonis]|uniref:Uncharacterized protein n=1 Tax=Acanthosepion pharaonis TaxID=158019 RepID=A0A812CY54_ACAPH|nr:unnamed protein product [Sepia pharaonis]